MSKFDPKRSPGFRRGKSATKPQAPPIWGSAFTTLYRANRDDVIRTARRFGVPERDSEDVAQDAFMSVLEAREEPRRFKPWLKGITVHKARDAARRAYRRKEELRPVENDGWNPAAAGEAPDRVAMNRQARCILREILEELGADLRKVLRMQVVDEMQIPAIAVALGICENTVRSRLHRAHVMFDAAVAKRCESGERRRGGHGTAALLPLLTPAAAFEAARGFPEAILAMAAGLWAVAVRFFGPKVIALKTALAATVGPVLATTAAPVLLVAASGMAGAGIHAAVRSPKPLLVAAKGTLELDRTMWRAFESPKAAADDERAAASSARGQGGRDVERAPEKSTTKRLAEVPAVDPEAKAQAAQALLARARAALASGKPDMALRDLTKHERLYPNDGMAEARRDLRRQAVDELSVRDGRAR